MIKGLATEVIDVGHFLPMAFADWFTRKEMRSSAVSQSVLLVDDSAFFRNMLAPVLKAAGYKVRVAPSAQEALATLRSGQNFNVVRDRHRDARDERLRVRRSDPRRPEPARDCRSSDCPRWSRRRRSSAAGRPASTITSPSSTVPA